MATDIQRYADNLTQRFYTARFSPPDIKPSERPPLDNYARRESDTNTSCIGVSVTQVLGTFSLCFETVLDSAGKCVNMIVDGNFTNTEVSRCMTREEGESIHGDQSTPFLLNGEPIRGQFFSSSPGSSPNITCLYGELYSVQYEGVCQLNTIACGGTDRPDQVSPCVSTQNYSYQREFSTCDPRNNLAPNLPGAIPAPPLDFPPRIPETLEYRINGYRTSWVMTQVMEDLVNQGFMRLRLPTSCECTRSDVSRIPGNIGPEVSVVDSVIEGREVTQVRQQQLPNNTPAPTDDVTPITTNTTRTTRTSTNTNRNTRSSSSGSSGYSSY